MQYAPLIDELATLHAEQESFLGRFFGGTVQSMLASYIESGNISQDELRQLREIIDREMSSRDTDQRSNKETRP